MLFQDLKMDYLSVVAVGASDSLATNVLRLVAERDLEAQCFNLALLPIRTTNDECSTSVK